ncbi:hypothetical protein ACFQX6_52475 [Streptosporangium lutulentum]
MDNHRHPYRTVPVAQRGIIQATGRRIAVRGCDVRTMDNGAIASQRVYYDQLEMLNQFNILCMPE